MRTELREPSERSGPLTDAELARALRALPRAASGPAFRATVLARAADAARRRDLRLRQWGRVAAGAALLAVGLGFWSLEGARERAAADGRRASLVDEHRRLQGELEDLRALAARRSQIRLGGDATTDLYLDLATVPDAASTDSTRPTIVSSRSHG